MCNTCGDVSLYEPAFSSMVLGSNARLVQSDLTHRCRQVTSDSLTDVLHCIWRERFRGVDAGAYTSGIRHASTPTAVLPMLKGASQDTLAFVPQVPEGNYFQRIFGGTPGAAVAPGQDLDVAHYSHVPYSHSVLYS